MYVCIHFLYSFSFIHFIFLNTVTPSAKAATPSAKRGPAGGRRVRGVLDGADPLSHFNEISSLPPNLCIIFVSFHFFS